MSRRFDARLKCQLPVTLLPHQGPPYLQGVIHDITHTHFRASFSEAISSFKRYAIKISLPESREVRGKVRVERSYKKNGDGVYDYVFLIESISHEEEQTLLGAIERIKELQQSERRKTDAQPEYRKNRRSGDRTLSQTGRTRVVITGIGVICANASNRAEFWKAIQERKCGIQPITQFDVSKFPIKIAGEVDDKAISDIVPRSKAAHMGRATKLGWAAAKLAVEDSELKLDKINLDRFGVAMGTTLGTLDWAFEQYASLHAGGFENQHPYTIAAGSANAVSGEISVEFGLRGPSLTLSQGCSSASMAIAYGLDLIQLGRVDAMIVGGTDAPLNPTVFGAFVKSGMLTNDLPSPLAGVMVRDQCTGSILGEGACALIIESYDHALQRNAPICAELVSSGNASDGRHMILPDPSGRGVSRAIREALASAKIDKEGIDLILGHFAGVKEAHDTEMRILKREFKNKFSSIPITNVKPLIGYTQGACGAFEVAAACLGLQEPTNWITYNNAQVTTKSGCALVNCIGFGGKNVSLVLRRAYDW